LEIKEETNYILINNTNNYHTDVDKGINNTEAI